MNRIHAGPNQTSDSRTSPDQWEKADAPAEAKTNDWSTETPHSWRRTTHSSIPRD